MSIINFTKVTRMKKLLLIIAILFWSNELLAIETFVTLPKEPQNLEAFTESEAIYFATYLDYFLTAAILESQLNSLGVKPKAKLPKISFELIENMETKQLKNIIKISAILDKQISELPESYNQKQIDCEKTKAEIEAKLFQLQLDTINCRNDAVMMQSMKAKIEEITQKSQDIENECYNKIADLTKENYELKYLVLSNEELSEKVILTFQISGKQFFLDKEFIHSEINPSFGINLKAFNISDNSAFIKLWADYTYLSTSVDFLEKTSQYNEMVWTDDYKDDVWTFGFDFELNLSKLFKINKTQWNFVVGSGFFKGFSKNCRSYFPKDDYSGNFVKAETNIRNFSKLFPFGFHIGTIFNYYQEPIRYHTWNELTAMMNNKWVPAVYAGFEFDLIKIY